MATDQLSDKEIFNFARRLDSREAVEEYLDQICGDDRERRQRILKLVEADKGDSFLEKPPVALPETVESRSSIEREGQVIGNYKLLQKIGEGGFGVVYMAEQTSPVRRQVALKIIKPGMDSKEVIARFEAERQALAMMDHPNIAKVFDGGQTESGHPFFVMELVKGVPLTKFCDENKLDTRERLRLFANVCNAIQHAHQKGVIHRDIKPSNVLVTLHDGKPVPKVIDFGVAKAMSQQLTAKTLFTKYGQMVGTPQYMSPEQAEMSGLDIDTRSDIYSLGVLLYELLTGTTPIDPARLRQTGYAEMQRMIREEEPPRPSKRLSTLGEQSVRIAAFRGSDPRTLSSVLRGELDWIAMKALEKDRSRRYDTANGLATDIRRHLANEPVIACPPTTAYVLKKAWQRHRRVALVCLGMLAILVLGLLGTIAGWLAEKEQREKAVRLQNIAESAEAKAKQFATDYRRRQFIADLNLAGQAVNENNRERLRQILDEYSPDEQVIKELGGFAFRYLTKIANADRGMTVSLPQSGRLPRFSLDGNLLVVGLTDNRSALISLSIAGRPEGGTVDLHWRRTLGLPHQNLWYPADVWILPSGEEIVRVSDDTLDVEVVDLNGHRRRIIAHLNDFLPSDDQIHSDHDRLLIRSELNRAKFIELQPQGEKVALGTNGGLLLASLGNEYQIDQLSTQSVGAIAFTSDGRILAFYDKNGIGFVDLEELSGVSASRIPLLQPSQVLAYSPDDQSLVVGTDDGFLQIFNAVSRQEIRRFRAHEDGLRDLRFSPDGKLFATGGRENVIKLWDWPKCSLVGELRGQGISCCFHPTEEVLACVSLDGEICFWDYVNAIPIGPLPLENAPLDLECAETETAFLIADSLNDYQCESVESELRLLRTNESARLDAMIGRDGKRLELFEFGNVEFTQVGKSEPTSIRASGFPIDLSPSGKLLLTGRQNAGAEIWKTSTAAKVFDLPTRLVNVNYAIPAGRFSSDESLVALAGADCSIQFFGVDSGELIFRLMGHSQGVVDLDQSPVDKNCWASSSWDRSAIIWDASSKAVKHRLTHRSWVGAVCFSPDGRELATVSADQTLKIWSVETGDQLLSLDTEMPHPRKVKFSRDGSRICVTANLPPSYRVFDASTGIDKSPSGSGHRNLRTVDRGSL